MAMALLGVIKLLMVVTDDVSIPVHIQAAVLQIATFVSISVGYYK